MSVHDASRNSVMQPVGLVKDTRTHGWVYSVLVHGLALGLAILATPAVRSPVVEPFRWEVTLVTPPAPAPAVTPVEPDVKPNPSRRAPTEASASHSAPAPTPVQPTPIAHVQPVQQAVAQVVERPVQQAVQPIVQRQAVQATVQPEPSTVQRATVDAHSSEVQSRTVHTVESVAAVTAEPVRTSGTHVVESSSAPTTKGEAVIAASGALVQTQGIMSAPAASVKDDGPPVVARPTVEAPSAPAVIREARTLSSAPTATVSAPQTSLSGAVGKNVKGDYRWLGEALVDRLKALQRYPSRARLNNWQGKVILQAVIKADGHLGEVVVLKSSGHQELDAAALDTLRLACPLHMKHALGVSEVKLTVPVVYSLD